MRWYYERFVARVWVVHANACGNVGGFVFRSNACISFHYIASGSRRLCFYIQVNVSGPRLRPFRLIFVMVRWSGLCPFNFYYVVTRSGLYPVRSQYRCINGPKCLCAVRVFACRVRWASYYCSIRDDTYSVNGSYRICTAYSISQCVRGATYRRAKYVISASAHRSK